MNGFYQTGQAFVQTGHAVHRFVRGCEKVNILEGAGFGHIWEGQAARLIKNIAYFLLNPFLQKIFPFATLTDTFQFRHPNHKTSPWKVPTERERTFAVSDHFHSASLAIFFKYL